MSRCQHNQRITKFCITPSCNHSHAGGCEYCFKRYHCHIGQTRFLKQNEVNQMIKYLTSFQDKKIKVRPLKQAIYNYFNVIKGQISTYLDCLSSDLLNKISYPYIRKEGNLNILKKLKHKEYNKLTTEQMIRISDFKDKNDPQKLQKNQILSYIEESKEVYKKISIINLLYKEFEKQTQESYLGESIMSVSIFYKKISQIYQHIENEKHSYLKKFEQSLTKIQGDSQIVKFKIPKQLKKANSHNERGYQIQSVNDSVKVSDQTQSSKKNKKVMPLPNLQTKFTKNQSLVQKNNISEQKKQNRSRKVSIDSRCSDMLVKSRLKTYEEKEKQITQRKLKLDQMMSKTQKKKEHNRESSSSSSSQRSKTNEYNNSLNQSATDSQAKKSGYREQMFAHTLLPEGKDEKRLYEQHQTIERKTLKIPVNVIPENVEDEQCQSPILRLKRSQKNKPIEGSTGFQLGLFKVKPSTDEEDTHSQPIDKVVESSSSQSGSQATSDKENYKPVVGQTKQMSINQNQANSLFLLVQSLKLSAKKAIVLLQAALKYAPHNFSAAEYLSYLYLEQNKPKQCLKVCNQALSFISGQPNEVQISIHLFNNKGAAMNMLGRFSESIPILQKCIEVKKKDTVYKNLGDAYFSLGITQKAVINYENAVVLNDQNHQALYNLAVCYYIQKNYDSSKLKVQRALMIDRDNQNYVQLYKQITNITAPQNK